MRNEDQKSMEFENERVSNLLGSLTRVEAPGDFDFHVRSRIAKGRPVDRKAVLLPGWVRFAVPLVLLLFVGGYFGFRAIYSPITLTDQPIAAVPATNIQPDVQTSTQVTEPLTNTMLAVQRDEKLPEANAKTKVASPDKLVARTGSSNKNFGGGSFDATRLISKPKVLKKLKDLENPGSIPAKDMLMQLGVEAAYSNSSWKVGGVKQNSMAERSGLKAGDVIEAINEQDLTEKTSFGSPFNGKSIRVRRDGKSVQIELKP